MNLHDFHKLQVRAAAWRMKKFPDSTASDVGFKGTEEYGEFCRAVIGSLEGREGRGDVGQEAAQTIIVISSLVGMFYPWLNLGDEIEKEMQRLDA